MGDFTPVKEVVSAISNGEMVVITDDANRENEGDLVMAAEAVIPPKKNRLEQREISLELYKDRNKVERFINRIKHYRRVATRYEKTARNYLAMLHLVSSLVWLL